MAMSITLRNALLATGAILAVALPGVASAAIVAPAHGFAPAASVTQVHWEYRHHHRYWVPDHRDAHHDDRR